MVDLGELARSWGLETHFVQDARRTRAGFVLSVLHPPGLNARLVRVPEATVVHAVRPAQWGVRVRQQRKNLFNALLYKKHPVLYRRKIQAAPPITYGGRDRPA